MLRKSGLLAAIVLLAAQPHMADAQGRVVMVVADNSDPSSIPENSPIFENAYREIADKLARKGITPRRASEFASARRLGARVSRDMAAAVETARNAGSPIAAVLAVRIYVSMHRGSKSNSFQLWIDGDSREIVLGRPIAEHRFRGRKRHEVERSCGRDCMLEMAEERIRDSAAEFGEAMAGKLADALPR